MGQPGRWHEKVTFEERLKEALGILAEEHFGKRPQPMWKPRDERAAGLTAAAAQPV